MINNGNVKSKLVKGARRNPRSYGELYDVGLECSISKVEYTPDFSIGFHELGGEIFPKAYKVDLTINPLTRVQQSGLDEATEGQEFFKPFNGVRIGSLTC